MNKTLALMLSFFALFSGVASAETLTPDFLKLDQNITVPYTFLFEEVGEVGENMDVFAKRVAPKLRAFSDKTGFEACGVIGKDKDGRYGVRIGSNNSHIACVNVDDFVPAGMTSTEVTIHSHGTDGSYRPNKSDFVLRPDLGAKLGYGAGRPMNIRKGQDLNMFSDMDFDGGDGYLATETGVIFARGGRLVSI